MLDLDFAGVRTVAEEAARQPEFATIERRALRISRRRSAVAGAAAAFLVAAAGTAVAVAASPGPDPRPDAVTPSPSGPFPSPGVPPSGVARSLIQSVQTADADHLYALLDPGACDGMSASCTLYLYASEDGGQSWQRRGPLPPDASRYFTVVGPQTLVAASSSVEFVSGAPQASTWTLHLSRDGGRTWAVTNIADDPIAAVPEGQRAHVCPLDSATVCAYDPAVERLARLGTQPPLMLVYIVDTPASAGLWVSGYDHTTHKPALAVSRDGGQTWDSHVFDDRSPPPDSPHGFIPTGWAASVATTDGQTAYAVFAGDRAKWVYRSTDGGLAWSLWQEQSGGPLTPFVYATRDGELVTLDQADGGFRAWISRDGGPYERVELSGLPPFGIQPMAVDGGFLTWTDDHIYRSEDGLTWVRLG